MFTRLSLGLVVIAIAVALGSRGNISSSQTGGAFVLEEATIEDVRAAFDAGILTCRRLTELYLNRITAYDKAGPRLNSIITVNPHAITDADSLDREWRVEGARSRLHCIPVLLKDNIDTADMPTTNGSALLRQSIPPDDAQLVVSLRRAGALLLGKASLGEFAGTSYNTVIGQVLNPYNPLRQTGGSSAGSGAAIAANLAMFSIGTDTSQSVRAPAAFNGLVGLRPTTGLVSRDGIAPKNLLFDTAGPIARTVTDAAIVLSAIAAPDPNDPLQFSARVYAEHPTYATAPRIGLSQRAGAPLRVDYTSYLRKGALKGMRIGLARQYWKGDPEIEKLANDVVTKLGQLGATIVDPVTFDGSFVDGVRAIADYRFKEDWETYTSTLGPAAPKTVDTFLREYDDVVDRSSLPLEGSVRRLLTQSLKHSSSEPAYQRLVDVTLPENTRKKLMIFDNDKLDALLMPFSTTFAPPIDNPVRKAADPTWKPYPDIRRGDSIAPYSSIGFPAIVVPMGFGSAGLPMGVTFIARPYEEGKLLGIAFDYEQASKLRRPPPLTPSLPGERISYQRGQRP
jgi:amidase